MPLYNTKSTFGTVHVLLHWLTAVTVFGLFSLGLWMSGLDYYHEWYRTAPAVHKSIGFVLILLMLFRVGWRLKNGMPEIIPTHKTWEKMLSKLVHLFLYVAIVSMFFSGYFITTAKGQSLDVLGFLSIPATITHVDSLEHYAEDIHEVSAYLIVVIAVLHGLAALKHHVIDKDRTLVRIFGK